MEIPPAFKLSDGPPVALETCLLRRDGHLKPFR